MKKEVKIVIPCYDRFDLLEITLQSLRSFRIPFETFLFFDGMVPDSLKHLAKKYKTELLETGETNNCGADEMICKSTRLFDDHVLIIDSDVRILNDFTPFVEKHLRFLEEDPAIAGISISKTFRHLNRYKGLDVMPFNIGCGTIYNKEHLDEACLMFRKDTGNEVDSTSGRLARKQKKHFINSYEVFTEHLGNRSGFHSGIDIIHV